MQTEAEKEKTVQCECEGYNMHACTVVGLLQQVREDQHKTARSGDMCGRGAPHAVPQKLVQKGERIEMCELLPEFWMYTV